MSKRPDSTLTKKRLQASLLLLEQVLFLEGCKSFCFGKVTWHLVTLHNTTRQRTKVPLQDNHNNDHKCIMSWSCTFYSRLLLGIFFEEHPCPNFVWLWRNGRRAQDHEDLRGHEDVREESAEGSCRCNQFGSTVVKGVAKTCCGRAVQAVGEDDWSDLMRSEELDPWMMAKLWESYYQARQENDPRKSNAQKVMKKSTDFLRRIIAQLKDRVCPHCHRCPREDHIWWVSMRHGRNSAIGGERRAAASTTGGKPNRILVTQDRVNGSEAKVFRSSRKINRITLEHYLLDIPLEDVGFISTTVVCIRYNRTQQQTKAPLHGPTTTTTTTKASRRSRL